MDKWSSGERERVMASAKTQGLEAYQWSRQPGAEGVVRELVAEFLKRNEAGAKLAERHRRFVAGSARGWAA